MEDIASSEDDLPDTEKPFDEEGIRVAEVHALGVSKPQVWHGQARLGSAHEITHRTAGRCRDGIWNLTCAVSWERGFCAHECRAILEIE